MQQRFIVSQRLLHERIEHAQDGSTLLLLDLEALGRANTSVAILLPVIQRALERCDGCFERVEERRGQSVRDQRVLVNRRGVCHAARAREKGLADDRRLRHLE